MTDNENDISTNKDYNRFTNLGTGYEEDGLFGYDGPQDGDDYNDNENNDNNENESNNNNNNNISNTKLQNTSSISSSYKIKYNLKLILLGDVFVGKTSLLLRYINNEFDEKLTPTLQVEKKTKSILLDSDTVANISIWDTCGQEKFRFLTKQYYNDIQAAIIVYDITDKTTFEQVNFWYNDLKENIDINKIIIMLIGNKTDKKNEAAVSWGEGKNFADIHKFSCFYEVSAKNGNNIELAFSDFTRKLVEKQIEDAKKEEMNNKIKKENEKIELNNVKFKKYKKNNCC
jgi:small GTP-binding protein